MPGRMKQPSCSARPSPDTFFLPLLAALHRDRASCRRQSIRTCHAISNRLPQRRVSTHVRNELTDWICDGARERIRLERRQASVDRARSSPPVSHGQCQGAGEQATRSRCPGRQKIALPDYSPSCDSDERWPPSIACAPRLGGRAPMAHSPPLGRHVQPRPHSARRPVLRPGRAPSEGRGRSRYARRGARDRHRTQPPAFLAIPVRRWAEIVVRAASLACLFSGGDHWKTVPASKPASPETPLMGQQVFQRASGLAQVSLRDLLAELAWPPEPRRLKLPTPLSLFECGSGARHSGNRYPSEV